jgi:hypothetical protein
LSTYLLDVFLEDLAVVVHGPLDRDDVRHYLLDENVLRQVLVLDLDRLKKTINNLFNGLQLNDFHQTFRLFVDDLDVPI